MRYAIFYTPPRDHPLTYKAASWLGRDAFSGLTLAHAECAGLALGEIAYFTAVPRRYGFHATLKAPFRLADGVDEADLLALAEQFSRQSVPVVIPKVKVARLGGFFAIVADEPNPALNDLAGRAVALFDKYRAPLTEKEFERREPEKLSTLQLRNLQNWGYPYVFDDFRFHMTLTGHVEPSDRPRVEAVLEAQFADVLAEPLEIDRIAVFIEREPGAPFVVHSMYEIPAAGRRRSA
jgi:putative phosphonate metabolism protein